MAESISSNLSSLPVMGFKSTTVRTTKRGTTTTTGGFEATGLDLALLFGVYVLGEWLHVWPWDKPRAPPPPPPPVIGSGPYAGWTIDAVSQVPASIRERQGMGAVLEERTVGGVRYVRTSTAVFAFYPNGRFIELPLSAWAGIVGTVAPSPGVGRAGGGFIPRR